ncbi:molecular chaperone DnaJ [Natrinema sp. CBA1119]|uniref:J domain-containing protein n=1 Tax=Natrinema sp. CBA1119 TaxID=1608465 RepID=UPI000BF57318|nr:DnaJ domain-containing protein [Natrinema sp. CBA1119]PGF18098.1 molecular chaperone DnaJ [Natrinema sp. CBA1119]
MGESYYEVLEVGSDATRDEIESAYRERVLETHPDHSDDPDAAERFQRVTTAKSVLTDGAERARYDRLGHDAYVGLARGPAGGEPPSGGDHANGAADSSGTDTVGSATDNGGATAAGRRKSGRSSGARTNRRTRSGTDGDGGARAGTHHARQRSNRQRRRKKRRATGDWPFDGDRSHPNGSPNSGSTAGPGDAADADGDGGSGFRYAVHDWDGAVDLEWEGQPIDGTTAVTVGSIAFLYPMLVVASLTPLFSLPVNVTVAACTLLLIGYLLTTPRVAMITFGVWSVLFPAGMVGFSLVDPLSLLGLLALGFAWVPFGYAVALWWALRP